MRPEDRGPHLKKRKEFPSKRKKRGMARERKEFSVMTFES